jgi:hypothetical protein
MAVCRRASASRFLYISGQLMDDRDAVIIPVFCMGGLNGG